MLNIGGVKMKEMYDVLIIGGGVEVPWPENCHGIV